MSMKEKLVKLKQEALEEKALVFSENIQPQLEEAAQDGESELLVLVKNEEKAFLDPHFIEMVSQLLDGLNVEVVSESNSLSLFSATQKYIQLSW